MIVTETVTYRGKEINLQELKPQSHIKVKVKCPHCGQIREVPYKQVTRNNHYLCQSCSIKIKERKNIPAGTRYGKWIVIGEAQKSGYSTCCCDCGNKKEVNNYSLICGLSTNCGCESKNREKSVIPTGQTFGRFTVVTPSNKPGYSICKCSCGNIREVANNNLKTGNTRSCGCLKKDIVREIATSRNTENSGEKHWNWKGGITSKRNRDMQKRKYKEWRTSVFQRDDYTCKKCGKHGGNLHAHHIEDYKTHPEQKYNTDNGITFCKDCHILFHHEYGKTNNRDQIDSFLYVSNFYRGEKQ